MEVYINSINKNYLLFSLLLFSNLFTQKTEALPEFTENTIKKGEFFFKKNKLDSAKYYFNIGLKSKKISDQINCRIQLVKINRYLGKTGLVTKNLKILKKQYGKIKSKKFKAEILYENATYLIRIKHDNFSAIEDLNRSKNLFDAVNDKNGILKANLVLANAYISLNYFELAKLYLEKVIILSEKYQINRFKSHVYNSLGGIYQRSEDYKTAKEYFEKSKQLLEKNNSLQTHHYAMFLRNIGLTHLRLSNYDQAHSILKQSLDIYNKNGISNHFSTLSLYNHLSELFLKTNKLDSSIHYMKMMEKRLTTLSNKHQRDRFLRIKNQHYVELYLRRKLYKKSFAYLDSNQVLFEKNNWKIYFKRNYFQFNFYQLKVLCAAYIDKKEGVRLSDVLKQIKEVHKSYQKLQLVTINFENKKAIYNLYRLSNELIINFFQSAHGLDEAERVNYIHHFINLNNSNLLTFLRLSNTRFLKKISTNHYSALSKLNMKYYQLKNHYLKTRKQKLLDSIITVNKKLDLYLIKMNQFSEKPFQVTERNTAQNELQLTYYIDKKKLIILTHFNETKKIKTISLTKKQYQYITSFASSIKKLNLNKYNEILKEISPLLLKSQYLEQAEKIIITPHDVLFSIPFETLKVNKKHLIEYAPVLYMKYFKNIDRVNEYKTNLIAFCPVFDKVTKLNYQGFQKEKLSIYRSTDSFENLTLNESEKEVRYISKLFSKNNLKNNTYFRNNASKGTFFKNPRAKILHFATHGIANRQSPELSSLLFLNDNKPEFLYSYEINHVSLQADLVNLASCETGVGQYIEGDGYLTISNLFQLNGANNTIQSLWRVNDKDTRLLNQKFYDYVLEGLSYSKALQKAKLWYIKNYNPLPRNWSGFVLYGNDGSLYN